MYITCTNVKSCTLRYAICKCNLRSADIADIITLSICTCNTVSRSVHLGDLAVHHHPTALFKGPMFSARAISCSNHSYPSRSPAPHLLSSVSPCGCRLLVLRERLALCVCVCVRSRVAAEAGRARAPPARPRPPLCADGCAGDGGGGACAVGVERTLLLTRADCGRATRCTARVRRARACACACACACAVRVDMRVTAERGRAARLVGDVLRFGLARLL